MGWYPKDFRNIGNSGLSGDLPGMAERELRELLRRPFRPTERNEFRELFKGPFRKAPVKRSFRTPRIDLRREIVEMAVLRKLPFRTAAKAISASLGWTRWQAPQWELPDDPGWHIEWCQPGVYLGDFIGSGSIYCGPLSTGDVTPGPVQESYAVGSLGEQRYRWEFNAYENGYGEPFDIRTIGKWHTDWYELGPPASPEDEWWPENPPAMPNEVPGQWTKVREAWKTFPRMRELPTPPRDPPELPVGRPGKRVKEKKFALTISDTLLGFIFNGVTELLDFLDCMHKALPKDKRAKPWFDDRRDTIQRYGHGVWKKPSPQDKAKAVYTHFDLIDGPSFMVCLLTNASSDRLEGKLGDLTRIANQVRGLMHGLAFGPAL